MKVEFPTFVKAYDFALQQVHTYLDMNGGGTKRITEKRFRTTGMMHITGRVPATGREIKVRVTTGDHGYHDPTTNGVYYAEVIKRV